MTIIPSSSSLTCSRRCKTKSGVSATLLYTDGRATILTPQSKVLLEKLITHRIVKIFLKFYRTRRHITMFITARRLILLCVTPLNNTTLRYNLILSTHLYLLFIHNLIHSGYPANIICYYTVASFCTLLINQQMYLMFRLICNILKKIV
jgi:hypothetical protein